MILGLGVTERMWRSSFGKGSDQIRVESESERVRVRGKCRTVLAAAISFGCALQRNDATGSAHVASSGGLEINIFFFF